MVKLVPHAPRNPDGLCRGRRDTEYGITAKICSENLDAVLTPLAFPPQCSNLLFICEQTSYRRLLAHMCNGVYVMHTRPR